MRLVAFAAAILLAGCFTPPSDAPPGAKNDTASDGGPTAEGASGSNASMPASGMEERRPASVERFYFKDDHSLAVLREDTGEIPVTNVRETISPAAFYQSFAQGLTLPPWASEAFQSAWESTGDIEVTISFTSNAPATSTNPKAAGFPAVGGWLGTTERAAFFLLATDAPDTLEAGKVYTVKLVAKPAQGGFFVREGEQLAISTFLSYQTADGGTASYVVGGPDPAGIVLPHTHFNLSAPREVVVLEENGELPPNPGPTGDMMQDPPTFSFSVPPGALYVVGEVSGAPKAGARADIDLTILSPGGDIIAAGSSSAATEKVALGPGNLQAYGRDLTAKITGSVIPAGGTFSVKITAYMP